MRTKLLTTEESFQIEGRGTIVTPGVPVDSLLGASLPRVVILRRPDGEVRTARAEFDIPRINPPATTLCYFCLLTGVTKDAVPKDTEIWTYDPAQHSAAL